MAGNSAAIWVNSLGQRFVNESGDSKEVDTAVFSQRPVTHWLIFDAGGRRKLMIRDAPGLNSKTLRQKILNNPEITQMANSIPALAAAAGLPADSLQKTVSRYNRMVAENHDRDFYRFQPDEGAQPASISVAPYYAIRLFPLTRKSMGGVLIDQAGRVLNEARQPVPGLFAAGELTGVAGINGSYGGSGTFLGPSVLIGRAAGRTAADSVSPGTPETPTEAIKPSVTTDVIGSDQLSSLIDQKRSGYWHFEVAHALVLERNAHCGQCHTESWPTRAAVTPLEQSTQLASCTDCH